MSTPQAQFWFDFASSYSYITLQRAEAAAQAAGVTLIWRPFLLGPIFGAQGWNDSPFNLYPVKGRFMVRDMARRAEAYGLPFRMPETFPINSVAAARLAIAALETPQGPAFCARVSRSYYADGNDITAAETLAACARDVGLDPEALSDSAAALKARLRENTDAAQALGVFGAPTVTVGDGASAEVFWGDDQFDDALAWAKTGRMAPRQV